MIGRWDYLQNALSLQLLGCYGKGGTSIRGCSRAFLPESSLLRATPGSASLAQQLPGVTPCRVDASVLPPKRRQRDACSRVWKPYYPSQCWFPRSSSLRRCTPNGNVSLHLKLGSRGNPGRTNHHALNAIRQPAAALWMVIKTRNLGNQGHSTPCLIWIRLAQRACPRRARRPK